MKTDRYGERAERSTTQHIEAPPERVFPLLCPVREADWLDGWSSELIHSASGFAEDGGVFRTVAANGADTVWMITRHSFAEGLVEFVRVTAGLVATRLRIELRPAPGDTTTVVIRYLHTPISEAGARFIAEHYSEGASHAAMAWWERSMNHFLASGTVLRAE